MYLSPELWRKLVPVGAVSGGIRALISLLLAEITWTGVELPGIVIETSAVLTENP